MASEPGLLFLPFCVARRAQIPGFFPFLSCLSLPLWGSAHHLSPAQNFPSRNCALYSLTRSFPIALQDCLPRSLLCSRPWHTVGAQEQALVSAWLYNEEPEVRPPAPGLLLMDQPDGPGAAPRWIDERMPFPCAAERAGLAPAAVCKGTEEACAELTPRGHSHLPAHSTHSRGLAPAPTLTAQADGPRPQWGPRVWWGWGRGRRGFEGQKLDQEVQGRFWCKVGVWGEGVGLMDYEWPHSGSLVTPGSQGL